MTLGGQQPRICQVVASINEDTGGPALSVTSLAEALSVCGLENQVCTLDYDRHGRQIMPAGVQVHSYQATVLTRHFRGFHPQAQRALRRLAQTRFDLIHNHGLWMFPNRYAYQAARRAHLPLLISPRGMLDTWSLNYNRMKKRLAWLLYERRNLRYATAFHATSAAEAQAIRNLGFRQPIAVLPNGISLPRCNEKSDRAVIIDSFAELRDKKWLLFMSRIHPKKGLEDLLHVWRELGAQFPDWQLVVAGSDIIGYEAELKRLVNELKLAEHVTFTGMLSGPRKQAALANADLFVLPTHSENFGLVVAEALTYGVPVVTTKNAPWRELTTHGCGWWIDNGRAELRAALCEAMGVSDTQRRAMGLRGYELVKTHYSWHQIAGKMADVYRWILSGGPAPDCVQL
jgi:glycosyltransferase involved in cell wall biosynthesis